MCIHCNYSQMEDTLVTTLPPCHGCHLDTLTSARNRCTRTACGARLSVHRERPHIAISQGNPNLHRAMIDLNGKTFHIFPHRVKRPSTLINRSWDTEQGPDHFKMTIIHPIPKSGKDSRNSENIQPIALTPVICKLIERLIHNGLQHHLEHTG